MKYDGHFLRRITALLLTLTMVFGSCDFGAVTATLAEGDPTGAVEVQAEIAPPAAESVPAAAPAAVAESAPAAAAPVEASAPATESAPAAAAPAEASVPATESAPAAAVPVEASAPSAESAAAPAAAPVEASAPATESAPAAAGPAEAPAQAAESAPASVTAPVEAPAPAVEATSAEAPATVIDSAPLELTESIAASVPEVNAAAQEPVTEEETKEETSTAEEPATGEELKEETPTAQEPVTEEAPKDETLTAEEPVTEEAPKEETPTAEEPVTEEATEEEAPAVEEPVTEDVPGEEDPTAEEPVTEDVPEKENSTAEEPVTEEVPKEEAPTAEEPATEEAPEEETPAGQEPVAEEAPEEETPASEEPVTEEVAQGADPEAEEPVTEETAQEEKTVDESLSETEIPSEDLAELSMPPEETITNAVSFGAASASGLGSSMKAKLLEMLDTAIREKTAEQKKVQITLAKDTTYDSDVDEVTFDAKDYQLGDDFEVEMIAEGAGDDPLKAESTTTIGTSLNIKGINVRMLGINMAAGKTVTVENAKLDYYGTKNDDAVTVKVTGDKGEANIVTGEGSDTVNVNMDGGKASVETGDGEDTVTASQEGTSELTVVTGADDDTVSLSMAGGTASVETGDGDDTVTSSQKGTSELSVDTGADKDTVNASIAQESTLSANTGAGDDTVNLIDSSLKKAEVSTGEGNDTVEVRATEDGGYSAGEINIATGAGDDSITLLNPDGKNAMTRNGAISVDTGSGVNDVTVDVGVAGIAPTVSIDSEDGNDQVHLTGSLNKDKDDDERITGDITALKIEADKGLLELTMKGLETLTDDLSNKRTKTLTPGEGNVVNFQYDEAEAFTNYIINAPASKLGSIRVSAGGDSVLLSNVVIDTDTTWDGENKLHIQEGAVIDVQGMNLQLKARNIEIDGTIKADVVQIEALDGTGMYARNLKDQYSAFKGTIDVPVLDEVGSGLAAAVTTAWDFVNIKDEATIKIGKKGAVLASGDVVMLAKVEQSGTMISFIPTNVVNVKVAHATIDVLGKVYAGVTNMDEVNADLDNVEVGGHGSVRASAEIKTIIGYDEKGKAEEGFLNWNAPLAVSVAYTQAKVNVAKDATIEAARDIKLSSKSEQKVSSRADSGLFGLPASIAVAVLVNDSITTVDGTLKAHGGNAAVTADGTIDAKTYAYKGDGQESKSGGYAAVTVALQDVKAELGKTALVQAKGKAQVQATATEKVDNHATSGSMKSEQGGDDDLVTMAKNEILKLIGEKLLPAVIDKVFPEEDSEKEKMEKAIKKIVSSDRSVQLDEKAQSKGEVKVTIDESQTTDNAVTGKVEVKPWEGYKVKSITWRGYNAGDAGYKTGKIETANGSFVFPVQNVTVFVEYEEKTDGTVDAPTDLFDDQHSINSTDDPTDVDDQHSINSTDDDDDLDIDQMLADIEREMEADEELDEELAQMSGDMKVADLELSGEGGAVLTYETDPLDNTKCLSEVILGEKIRLIPNPASGNKLKTGGLKAEYYVTETKDDAEVITKKTVIINPDAQGRYFFTVPNDMDTNQPLKIRGEYETGESTKEGDESQTQLTGTVAVAVTDNDNQAIIQDGAVVEAGSLELTAKANTDIANAADGSAVNKTEEKKDDKKDSLAIQRPAGKEYKGYDAEGLKYGLLVDATQYGAVECVKNTDSAGLYDYVLEAKAEEGYTVGTARVTYYVDGEKKTAELEPDADGKYHFNLAAADLNADAGSTAVIAFGFVKKEAAGEGEETPVTVSNANAPQVIIANPILITYNANKDEKQDTIGSTQGTITYEAGKVKKDENGQITAYAFKASPDTAKGYLLDGKLKAIFRDTSGKEQTKELTEEDGVWYLENDGIAAGSPIKVSGAFKDDLHDFAVGDGVKNGKVTLHDEKVKKSDAPKLTVKADAGYSLDDITVTYEDADGNEKTIKLSDSQSALKKAKNDKGEEIADTYTFTVPGMKDDSKVEVSASFKQKSIGINKGEMDTDKNIDLSESFAAAGDKITVTPIADKIKEGYKITKITVTAEGEENPIATVEGGASFTIPKDTEATHLTVKAEMALKTVVLEKTELTNGAVTPNTARADRGEKVTVTVQPKDNFKVKTGTLKAVIKNENGDTEEIFMHRQNDTTYTFDLPSNMNEKSTVTFTGEFEPGQSNSSEFETSLGAGIAVTVANSESSADLKGKVTTGGNVKISAENLGGIKTETKAGYSKGKIGMGGAVSVQVGSMDAKARVFKSADVALDGKLSVDAKTEADFSVTGDASGNKAADQVGVGAGIAVAVNGSDTFAAVQDGATIRGMTQADAATGTEASDPKGISITAVQKVKDTVTAKAGASGGTAVVPVAAVDVISSTAKASLGRLSNVPADGKLKLKENVAVSTMLEAEHTITADAAAAGKGAGVGGAFGVSVVSDEGTATLSQSVEAAQVTVTAQTIAKLNETATASASGGKSEKNSKSADKKADGLAGMAANLAGKNKSSGMSGGKIGDMTKNRQKAETSEGSVGVAGAIVVNVQHSTSRAEILDGVNVKADGLVAVTAVNGTTSKVKANASSTKSTIGVGVGVAVNVLFLDNIARMGDGEIEAAMLKVSATTKETPPESAEKKETKEVKDEEDLSSELGEMVRGYIYDLAEEIGLDQYVPEDLMNKILKPVIDDVLKTLLDATNLSTLFKSTDEIKAKYDAFMDLLSDPTGLFADLPEELFGPLMTSVEDALDLDLSVLSPEELEAFMGDLQDEFTGNLLDNITNWKSIGGNLFNTMKDSLIKYFTEEGTNILKGMFTGDKKAENWKKFTTEIGKYLGQAVAKEVKSLTEKTVKDTFQNVKLPDSLQQALDAPERIANAFNNVKDAWNQLTLENIFDKAAGKVVEKFRTDIFDYEVVLKGLTDADFTKKIADGIRNAAKKAQVTLTNEAVGKLLTTMNVALEPGEGTTTGHVIDTQAISGTGAKDVGVAGSVAITVLNAATEATIGASGNKINVTQDMTVEAKELRSVKNVASAALDKKGNAKDNKSSEKAANEDAGGSGDTSTAKGKHATLEARAGATATLTTADSVDDKPKFYVTIQEGYQLKAEKEGNEDKYYAQYSYTDKAGQEQTGKVAMTKDGDRWVVNSKDVKDKDGNDLPAETDVRLVVTPEEVLRELPKVDFSMSEVKPAEDEKDAVTLSVKGREQEEGKIVARAGEKVEITIKKVDGRKVKEIGVSYKDAEGNYKDVYLPISSSTSKEVTYVFDMPDAEVEAILVNLVESEGAEESGNSDSAEDNENKDGSGTSVGVGAAFSMVYGDVDVKAQTGSRSEIKAGEITMSAESEHQEDISSAAGTDPLSGELDIDATKDFSLDASVALNILDHNIIAEIGQDTAVETTGYTVAAETEGEEDTVKDGDLSITARETARTETTSSAFAVGGETAVGASVAINISDSDVKAKLISGADVAGSAAVSANSHSEDKTSAMATAMGADIARNLAKAGETAENIAEKSNKVLDGSIWDGSEEKKSTDTGSKINERLDKKQGEEGEKTAAGGPVSTSALKSQGVKTAGDKAAEEGKKEAKDQLKDQALDEVGLGSGDNEPTKVQVAAAVGLTIASHNAQTEIGGITAGKGISATAENTGNFNTMGTGAAMSLAKKANSIAFGVAVSVNDNASGVKVNGDLTGTEDINVTSRLTQNMDGDFRGKLAAQALAGSVSGDESGVSLAGAVSVVVSHGKSNVEIAGGTADENRKISGANVTVEATDKSKLAARAGGISLSKGSSVGMGIASTNIISGNTVTATLGDYMTVEADSFRLNAEKQAVTKDDYENLIDLKYLATDSSALSEEERKEAKTGLLDFHKEKDKDGNENYKVEVNLSSEKLLEAVDGLNFLSAQNTYAEAIGGSVIAGSGTSLAGSFAVAVDKNTVEAMLGKNATVNLRGGDMTVNAANGNTARIIAGSLAVSAGKKSSSGGLSVSVLVDNNSVASEIGENAEISDVNNFTQNAEATGDLQAFTVAAAVATGNVYGGAVNVIVTKNASEAKLGDGASITAAGDVKVNSKTDLDLTDISVSAPLGLGQTAAGGTVNVIVDKSVSNTAVGDKATIKAGKNLTIASDVSDQMISGTASASMAMTTPASTPDEGDGEGETSGDSDSEGGSGSGTPSGSAFAGVVNVIVSKSVADTSVGSSAALTAQEEDLKVSANNDAWMLNASLALAANLGVGDATGASINVNVFNREAKVNLKDGTLQAGGNLIAESAGKDTSILAGLSIAGSVGAGSLAGNIGVLVEKNRINTLIDKGVTATAGKNAILESYYSDFTVDAAGTIAAGAEGATGATILTVVKSNNIRTKLEESSVTAYAKDGSAIKNRLGNDVPGLYVGANAKETQVIGGAGVAVSGMPNPTSNDMFSSLNGVVSVLVNNNKVYADASKADLISYEETYSEYDPEMYLDVREVNAQGQVVTGYTRQSKYIVDEWKDPRYHIYKPNGKGGWIEITDPKEQGDQTITGGDVTVEASDDTKQVVFAGGLSISAGAGLGAAVVTIVSNKDVRALAHNIDGYSAKVSADNRDDITQVAVSAGISAGDDAIQIGASVQVLQSRALAETDGTVNARKNGFDLISNNRTDLDNAAVTLAVGGSSAATPVGIVTYFRGESEALLKEGASVTSAKGVNISASADKSIGGYTIGAAASGGLGLSGAVNVIVTRDKTKAAAAYGTTITANDGDLNIHAHSDYKLRALSAAVAASVGADLSATQAAVAINAVVSVLKGSTIAQLDGQAIATKNKVDVNAYSKRDVIDAAASVSAGLFGPSVGVTLLALVAGTKMSQDASDMLVYGNAKEKTDDQKTFDSGKFMGAADVHNSSKYYDTEVQYDEDGNAILDENGNEVRTDNEETLANIMTQDLLGNGHRESEQTVGSKSEEKPNESRFDASSKYRSDDFDKKNYEDSSDTGRGENLETQKTIYYDKDGNVTTDKEKAVRSEVIDDSDTTDVANAKKVNVYKYEDPTDAVIAEITKNAIVEAKAVHVEAKQPVAADVIGATIAASSRTGVGISAAFAMLHSNVIAASTGVIKNATDGVNVQAFSIGGDFDNDQEADARSDALADYLSNSNKKQDEVTEADLSYAEKEELKHIDNDTEREKRKQQMLADKKAKNQEDKNSLKKDLLEKIQSRSIRVLGIAVGAGTTSVAVGAGVALTDNVTRAELGGRVINAGDVNVSANHDYGSVMAATGAVAAGGTAVAASVAVAQANGSVKSILSANAAAPVEDGKEAYDITSTGNVNVTSLSNVDVDALAASVGIGGTAVNAGVALAFNRLTQETGLIQGVKVQAGKDVNVLAESDTTSNTYLLGVAVGGTAVSLNAAVSNVAVQVDTHVGSSIPATAGTTSDDVPPAIIRALKGDVTIQNRITSSAIPKLLSVAVGAVAAGGNVLLAFNETEAQAAADNADISAKNLLVNGNLSGTANSSLLAATVGMNSVGVSVNYADMRAANRAVIMNSAIQTSNSTQVVTNRNNEATTAKAHTLSASLGLITGGMNAAIARNNSKSYATVIGDKQLDVGELTIHAKGNSSAKAEVEGLNIGLASAAATAVVALNDADARTSLLVGNTQGRVDEKGDLILDDQGREYYDGVKNVLKANRGITLNASQNGETDASIETGGGSLLGTGISVALAYGRTNSIVDAAVNGGGEYAYLMSANNGVDKTTSNIKNKAFSLLSANALFGTAYSQDLYRTKIKLTGGDYVIKGNADVTMDYTVTGVTDVQPSAGGVNVSLASAGINGAIAKNTAYAGTDFEIAMGKESQIWGDANVQTKGTTFTNAKVRTAELTATSAELTANIAKADLSMTQAAAMRVGGNLTVYGDINIESLVRDNTVQVGDTTGQSGTALASIGTGGAAAKKDDPKKPSVNISIANLGISKAIAKENLSNSALLLGAAYGTGDVLVPVDKGHYMTWTDDEAIDYDTVTSIDYKLTKSGYEIKNSTKSDQEVKSEIIEYYVQGTHFGKWGNVEWNSTVYEFTKSEDRQHMLEVIDRYRTSFDEATELCGFLGHYSDDQLRNFDINKLKLAFGVVKQKKMSDDFAQALEEIGTTWAVKNEEIETYPEVKIDDDGETTTAKKLTFGDFLVYYKHREKWAHPNEDFRQLAYRTCAVYSDVKEYDLFDWEETYHYGTKAVTVTEWVPQIEYINGLAEVFETDKNILTAQKNLNIKAGMENSSARTMAQARTDGAKTAVNFLSAGSMEAESKSTDSMSAMLEGVHATVAGTATLTAASNTYSEALGYKSGGISGFSGGKSTMSASVGSSDDRQTTNVVIGEGASLTAKEISLNATNKGSTEAKMDSGKIISGGSISSSSQPTYSFYSTLISVGPGATLETTEGDLKLTTYDTPTAKSTVTTNSMGIGLDFKTMRGQNFIQQENNIDIGESAHLTAKKGRINVEASQTTNADAEILSNGGSFGVKKDTATAENYITRAARISVGEDAQIKAENDSVNIRVQGGLYDKIITKATVDSYGLVAIGDTKAYTKLDTDNEVLINQGADIFAKKDLDIIAWSHSYEKTSQKYTWKDENGKEQTATGYKPGVYTEANVDNLGGVPLPNATAKVEMNNNNYIGVNRAEPILDEKGNVIGFQQHEKRVNLQAEGKLQVRTGNYDTVQTKSNAKGKGVGGVSNATSWILGNVTTAVWIDNADMNAPTVQVITSTGQAQDRTHFIADSYTELKALAGKVAPTTRVSGLVLRQIRSNDTNQVTWGVPTIEKVPVPVYKYRRVMTPDGPDEIPYVNSYDYVDKLVYKGDIQHNRDTSPIWTQTSANYKRWQKKIFGVTITLTKAKVTNKIEWGVFNRCDFCDEGDKADVGPGYQDSTMAERYEEAYKRAIANIDVIEAMAKALSIDKTALMASKLAKGLLPLTYMNTLATRTAPITKARYGDEENEAAAKVFVMDVTGMLEKDVRISKDELAFYRMWENNATFHSAYMLPNATRLYTSGNWLDYVTDIVSGELLDDGYTYEMEVITALNKNAYANPEIPIGKTGSLNFATGVLTIPSYTDFELYLHEVSAAWLIEQMQSGYIRTLMGNQEEFNTCATDGSEKLPEGTIVEGVTDGGTVEGIQLYWIGDTPETAADPDQALILLMVNEETDEVDAFRTSVNMLNENAPLVDLSMYLFRDSESDRREEEKYNLFWFDTFKEGITEDLSLVKVLTNVVGGRLEMPRPIRVVLRAYTMPGIDLPVYSLTDHLFVLCDGTKGIVSLFDDAYHATFDGDVFDSEYTRVEGISTGDLVVTIKKDQPVWPEWIDEDEAQDIGGKKYYLTENQWTEENAAPEAQADASSSNAA